MTAGHQPALHDDPPTGTDDLQTALILPPNENSFRIVAGLPLIARTALSAQRAGFSRILALPGAEAARLRTLLQGDPRTAAVNVIDGDVATALGGVPLAVLPSDCFLTPEALQQARASTNESTRGLLLRDVRERDGAGVLIANGTEVLELLEARRRGNGSLPAHALEDPEVRELDGEICMRVSGPVDEREAERRMVAQLRAATAETDGPIARFDRAISSRLSRWLVRTPLRPNHITTIGTGIGLFGAWLLARGTYGSGLLGCLLFWAAVILDGCDGEVARLKMQESNFGYLYDVTTDNIVHAAIFLGLGVGQYRAAPQQNHAVLIWLLLGGFACACIATYFCLIRHPPVQRLQPRSRRGRLRQRFLRLFELAMNRDFAYLLLGLAVIGRLGWFLWAAAYGTFLYAGGLFWVYRWRDAD
jgi:phosphatidylglycerophosphate synthase